ncbi:hypothetical protein niasHS_001071 [Heterodera schachtii]|uniref:Uncharacterized protein n=1 Tax=Heterodera schachtii TaxID=97005 RepID=A0ABD2K8P9_HETSC
MVLMRWGQIAADKPRQSAGRRTDVDSAEMAFLLNQHCPFQSRAFSPPGTALKWAIQSLIVVDNDYSVNDVRSGATNINDVHSERIAKTRQHSIQ